MQLAPTFDPYPHPQLHNNPPPPQSVQQGQQQIHYVQFPPHVAHRVSQHISQGEQQIVQQRGSSPPIVISYNEGQRAVSSQQASVVRQVYQQVPQGQMIAYEQK